VKSCLAERSAIPLPATAFLLLFVAAPPDAGLPDPIELRQELLVAAMREEPCNALAGLLGQADALLDARATSDAFELLGEILRVWSQACPGPAPARHAPDADTAFAKAVELKPDGGPASPAVQWNGLLLRRSGEQRIGRAQAALASGDLFAARRELRLLRYESVDAAMELASPERQQSLWEELARREPQPRVHRHAGTPEDAIRSLEHAAVYDDAAGVEGLLSRHCPQRALFEGGGEEDSCDEYRDERSLLLMCVLGELLPEAPDKIACNSDGKTAHCQVTGRSEQRTVYLEREGAGWRFAAVPPGVPGG